MSTGKSKAVSKYRIQQAGNPWIVTVDPIPGMSRPQIWYPPPVFAKPIVIHIRGSSSQPSEPYRFTKGRILPIRAARECTLISLEGKAVTILTHPFSLKLIRKFLCDILLVESAYSGSLRESNGITIKMLNEVATRFRAGGIGDSVAVDSEPG